MSVPPPPDPVTVPAPRPSQPMPECDIVMKGGITSGLVYPPAILELKDKYRLRSIGGASAGAIGAAGAAAAELCRETGGYVRLDKQRGELASPGFIVDLFQPSTATEPLYRTILALKPLWDASMAAQNAVADARSAATASRHVAEMASLTADTSAAAEVRKQAADAEAAARATQVESEAAARGAKRACAANSADEATQAATVASVAAAKASQSAMTALAARDEAIHLCVCAGVLPPPVPTEADAPAAKSAGAQLAQWLPRIERVLEQTFPTDHFKGRVAGFFAGVVLSTPVSVSWVFHDRWPLAIAALAVAIALGVLGASVGGFVAVALKLEKAYAFLSDKQRSYFGFCFGSRGAAAAAPTKDEKLPLTDWLHQGINQLAEKTFDAAPLTIGELAGKTIVENGKERSVGIAFKMVTTDLSQAQPVVFPNDDRRLLFDARDMARFFPKSVVDHLVAHPPPRRAKRNGRPTADEVVSLPEHFHFLPVGGDLPVVVATRLSLSFPVLLAAIRLYTIKGSAFQAARAYHDATKHDPAKGRFPLDADRDLEESWFSDGGIAANFPLSIFDAWVPSRPTFGIDLRDAPMADRVPRPAKHEQVILPRAGARDDTLSRPTPIAGLVDLFLAMLDTARSARDNSQAEMASYRERVTTVYLAPDEGGLNLGMSQEALDGITKKGKEAGERIINEFSLDEHFWVRTRLLMSHLEQEFATIAAGFAAPDGTLQQLRDRFQEVFDAQLAAHRDAKLRFYRSQDQVWCDEATARIGDLIDLMEQWHVAQQRWIRTHPAVVSAHPELGDHFFHVDPPKPSGALRVTTRV